MEVYKKLRDPIYGYVKIRKEFIKDIIDTAEFQRLRRIVQTSYSSLYSSSVHNRFVHSLGVFYLGEICAEQLKNEILLSSEKENDDFDDFKDKVEKYAELFKLACLLHDVGHAPFSHTGENFYKDSDGSVRGLHNKLIKTVNLDSFSDDVPDGNSKSAAPHEIMGAIVGIISFPKYFKDNESKDFFARCITGYKYKVKNEYNSIANCFITMLNSKIIDVDKLDYLIRDAYETGFQTVSIDYERLLTSITVHKKDNQYEIAYYKGAISVIENVIYAHDSERKWIQSHPVIIYENYLLKLAINKLNNILNNDKSKLFSYESLGNKPVKLENDVEVQLLCDDDIIHLIKRFCNKEDWEELFDRNKRRYPIWKSEAEYNAYVINYIGTKKAFERFHNSMNMVASYVNGDSGVTVINDNSISKLDKEIQELEIRTDIKYIDDDQRKSLIEDRKKIIKIFNFLKKYSNEMEVDFDFVLLTENKFASSFGKNDFSDINIKLKKGDDAEPEKFIDIVSSLDVKDKIESPKSQFFYLYHKRDINHNRTIDGQDICGRLIAELII